MEAGRARGAPERQLRSLRRLLDNADEHQGVIGGLLLRLLSSSWVLHVWHKAGLGRWLASTEQGLLQLRPLSFGQLNGRFRFLDRSTRIG